MSDKRFDNSNLKSAIDNSGMTREQIAEKVGCDTSSITKYYNGDRYPKTDIIIKLAKLFNYSTDYLLGLTETPVELNTDNKTALRISCDYTGLMPELIEYLNTFKNELKSKYSQNDQFYNYKLKFFNCYIGEYFCIDHWIDFLKVLSDKEKQLLKDYSKKIDNAFEALNFSSKKASLSDYDQILNDVLNSSELDKNDIEYTGTIYRIQSNFIDFILEQIGATEIKKLVRDTEIKEHSFKAHINKLKQGINSNEQ